VCGGGAYTMILVNVKWGTRRFERLELDPTRKPLDLKRQLAELTGVETSRQQLMVKGALVRDDDSWGAHAVKDGSTLLLVAASRPSCSDGAPSTGTVARGHCARCYDAARSAGEWVWWLLINMFPLMFSFLWTMFDKNAGAAGNRIAVQRQTQQRRAAPPPRLVQNTFRHHHLHTACCAWRLMSSADIAADNLVGPWARHWRRRWQRRQRRRRRQRRGIKASSANPFVSHEPVWILTTTWSSYMNTGHHFRVSFKQGLRSHLRLHGCIPRAWICSAQRRERHSFIWPP
jgi:hypothetical protein